MHDATVDRTTDGTGRVSEMTLVDLKGLRLRENFGGKVLPQPSEQRVVSLAEMPATVQAADMTEEILIKSEVTDPPLPLMADQVPYREALYMPIL